MKSVLKSNNYNIIVDGASIRIDNKDKEQIHKVGIVSIIPKVQIILGGELKMFLDALELSRLPIALRRTVVKGAYETYDIIRLQTGNIREATLATLAVYNGLMVGITYNRAVLFDKDFRRLVKLSAMHQITIGKKSGAAGLLAATDCISKLTGVPRDKLVVVQKARSIRVRASFRTKLDLPLYYIFAMDKSLNYNLVQISFDYNEVAKRINK